MSGRANFYLIRDDSLRQTIAGIAEKIYGEGLISVFLCESDAIVSEIDDLLWTATRSFVPHGIGSCGYRDEHPICVTADLNEAQSGVDCIITLNIYNQVVVDFAVKCKAAAHIFDITRNSDDIDTMRNAYRRCDVEPVIWERKNAAWHRL